MLALRTSSALSLVTALSLTGCLVSFEDYPLSALGSGGSRASESGSDAGGASAGIAAGDSGPGGSAAGDLALGGSASGGAAMGGSATGGDTTGGAAMGGSAAGGDAGGAGMGGAPAGGSAAGGAGGAVMPPSDLLIDDFEDGDNLIVPVAGRNGAWFVSNDGSSQQTPDPKMACLPSLLNPPRAASTMALHTTGANFTTWGAMVGANFVVNGITVQPYDISAHLGVTFTAKIGKATSVKQVRVSIRNYDTLYGCTVCGDPFGATATMSDTFTTIQVPFASMKQQGFGKPQLPNFDTKRTYAITFSWAAHQTFDVWIDDVAFY
jgi:hypothetical protein